MTDVRTAAVLVDGDTIQEWQRQAIERMVADTDVTVDLLVSNEGNSSDEQNDDDGLLRTMVDMSGWNYYRAYRRHRGEISARSRTHLQDVEWAENATRLRTQAQPTDRLGNTLPADAVDAIGECDVAIRFGFGILKGRVLCAPVQGVLSYHAGDLTKYRGRPAGFWEFLHGKQEVGVTLQRLTETLDGGEIVAYETVDIRTATSWPAVQQRIFESAPGVLVQGIHNLNDEAFTPEKPAQLGDLYTTPTVVDLSRYVLRTARKTLF